jgi:E1A/CREB-binding protein
MYNAFTVASKQIGNEMDSSPDINSSITTISCGDGFPETGTFDSGPVFSQGDHPYHLEAFKDIFQQQHFDQSMFICISTRKS